MLNLDGLNLAGTKLDSTIVRAVAGLGDGPLTEAGLVRHVHPLFSRTLERGRRTGEIYLANHSLGRPLDMMATDVARALDAWYAGQDEAWGPWFDEMQAYRAAIAQLIGCSRWDCVVPKTAAGQGLRAVLNALPWRGSKPVVLTTAGEFDSIDFILRTYAQRGEIELRWVPVREAAHGGASLPTIDPQEVIERIRTAHAPRLVVVSQVAFATGQVVEGMSAIVREAHARGAMVMIDTYHSAGVMPVRFDACGADFAVGGNYKYTRGGPGACWLCVHPRHLTEVGSEAQPELRTLDTGWFAKRDTFKYQRPEHPLLSGGGDAWLESTPAVLPFFQARSGLHLTLALGVERLRAYSLEQQGVLRDALAARGVQVVPRPLETGGAFLLLRSERAQELCAELKRAGVNVDARGAFVRLCPDILTTRAEMEEAAGRIAGCLEASRKADCADAARR
jgi:kynureninase